MHLGSYCSKGWKSQKVIGESYERKILSTLSYTCFYSFYTLFYTSITKNNKVYMIWIINEKNIQKFDYISLAIMSCGYILDKTYAHWVHGLSFVFLINKKTMKAWEYGLLLLQFRLKELGIYSEMSLSVFFFIKKTIDMTNLNLD